MKLKSQLLLDVLVLEAQRAALALAQQFRVLVAGRWEIACDVCVWSRNLGLCSLLLCFSLKLISIGIDNTPERTRSWEQGEGYPLIIESTRAFRF